MIRGGINRKNLEYWRDEVFRKVHGNDFDTAELKAQLICQEQEIKINRERIIKLEKQLNK